MSWNHIGLKADLEAMTQLPGPAHNDLSTIYCY